MGSGVSRKNNSPPDPETTCRSSGKSVCSNCGRGTNSTRKEETDRTSRNKPRRQADVGLDKEDHPINGVTNPTKRFYYYPKKNSSEEETLYVSTSQFPYTKPKAVVVRQHVVQNKIRVEDSHFPQPDEYRSDSDDKYQIAQYPKLHAALQEHAVAKDTHRSYQFVNDRRWKNPSVMVSSGFAHEKILPHKAVSDLRRTNLKYAAHDQYERYCAYNYDVDTAGRRPPTPSTSAWYPARRSNDYLVASSLLAMERQRDRMKAEKNSVNNDIYNF